MDPTRRWDRPSLCFKPVEIVGHSIFECLQLVATDARH